MAGSLLENVGNIYALSEKGPEKVSYKTMTPRYLDPTASLRDVDIQNRMAAADVASGAGGNSQSYLGARVALATKAAINKDRVRREYENANAQIGNRAGEYNTAIMNEQIIDQAKNDAAYRNIRRTAVGSLGTNLAGTTKDISAHNMDKQMVSILPELYNNPEFKSLMIKLGYSK